MSNIDSLLDLDDMNSDPPPEVKDTTGVTSPHASDPFDPFSTQYDQTPSEGEQKDQFTGFDPFAQIVESPDTISPTDPFAGTDPFQQNQHINSHISSGLVDIGGTGDADEFDPFSGGLKETNGGTGDLLGGSVTSPDLEGPEGSYDLLQGTAITHNDLIEEEDEDEEDEDEEDEENSVVEKDDLPEKATKAVAEDNDSMAELSENERRGYESQFDDLMGGAPAQEATNGHQDYYDEGEEEEEVAAEGSYQEEAREAYSPPASPETHSGEVVTTQEGGSFDGGISPSRLEDTLPTFQQPKRYVKPEEKRESKAAPGVIIMSHVGAGDNRCALCDKRVYEMEKMIADKAIYHKMCFKCSHCKRILSLGNFASMEGMLYCKPHFIEMFKTKGNYDEGFGKEKHSKQWQKESTPTRDQSAAADDKFDDGIESVQSISNIKNRFQNKDEKPPMPGDSMNRSSRSSNGHVNGDRTPPEVVNRSESQEDILGRELPPVNMARSMASKFRDMESSDSSSDRKPVRKMTPPRDDVERDVGRYNEEVERRGDVIRSDEAMEKEDERPPPSFTRNMLAKFKEMEDTERPPPSPARSATSPTKRTHRPIATHIKSSPDEGIADTEPVNGHRGAEVIREADKNETEELPERGFTKSLVSQWRQIEQTAGGPTKSPLAPRQHGSTPSAVRNATTYRHASPANSESDEQREVVRESDNYEEENLPPPSYTKNMLAKFQNMQEEAQRDPATTPTKKQFKWTVKETKPLWAPPTGKDELQLQSVNGHDVTYKEAFSSEEEEYEDTISLECDEFGNPVYPVNHPKHPNNVRRRKERRMKRSSQEVISSNGPAETEESLPAPETTKKLLSQFKSMEDVSAPPPTPEMSVQRQRSTRSSISAVPMRYSTSSMESREQPDGIETTEVIIDRESSSEERTDVVREADSDVAAELPEQGTTRNLLARFQSLQAV